MEESIQIVQPAYNMASPPYTHESLSVRIDLDHGKSVSASSDNPSVVLVYRKNKKPIELNLAEVNKLKDILQMMETYENKKRQKT